MACDNFVPKAVDKVLQTIRPQPSSEFFCKWCNYAEFPSNHALERHNQSARHLVSFFIIINI